MTGASPLPASASSISSTTAKASVARPIAVSIRAGIGQDRPEPGGVLRPNSDFVLLASRTGRAARQRNQFRSCDVAEIKRQQQGGG